jgi:integrase
MKGVRIVWKSHSSITNKGYLRLSVRNSEIGKTKIISLNLPPISEYHFDKVKQRVKSSFKDYEKYNSKIEEILKDYDRRETTDFIKDEKKILNYFVESLLIPNCKSQGTVEKYRNILNLLILFNKEKYNREEIYFKSIDVKFINDWKVWLRNERKLTENTISYKTKTFSSFISKSTNQGHYVFIPNPFKSIRNVISDKQVEYLSEEEIERLINTELYEIIRNNKELGDRKVPDLKGNYKNSFSINEVRNWFLFSLFQHGIRISDVMTLRWNNFYVDDGDLRFSKRMIKTKHNIKSLVYFPSVFILKNYIPTNIITDEEKRKIEQLNSSQNWFNSIKRDDDGLDIILKFENKFNFDFEKSSGGYIVSENKIDELTEKITKEITISSKYKTSNGFFLIEDFDFELDDKLINDERLIQLRKLRNHLISLKQNHAKDLKYVTNDINLKVYKLIIDIVLRLKNNPIYSNNFVFPILNDDDFMNIKKEEDFDRMDKKQYLRFSGRRTYYNRLLKFVGNQCGILNLKYNKDVNLYDLMESLGHKNLSTTQGYIQSFVNRRVDDIGKGFSDKFINNLKKNIT